MEVRLDGRIALITGGSKGLGFAMADTFMASGAEVALVARDQTTLNAAVEQLQAKYQGRARAYVCDVSVAADINATWQQVMDEFGRVDILVNNAGLAKGGTFETITDEDWQYDFDLKLMAAVRFTRLAFPGMKERQWGRVLNMLNTFAKAPTARTAPTSVTRAAGMALTKVLAGEGAPFNVLVNALNIGLIKSDQIQRGYAAAKTDLTFDEFVAKTGASLPMGRMGEAQECANLACLLCSDAGGYVTGAAINMDGGMCPVV